MAAMFEELDFRPTPMGDLSLRRRRVLSLGTQVYEVKLGDEFLMSSMFTVGEQALSELGLAATQGDVLDVAVGGLGLGYTAARALEDPRVRSLVVIDALQGVIDWHQAGLVPLGPILSGDPRYRLQLGDFFALARSDEGLDPQHPGRKFDAVLLDIDHSPRSLLSDAHGGFYTAEGLKRLAAHIKPGGVFALWSDERPDPAFEAVLGEAFANFTSTLVEFDNPLQDIVSACTIYVART
jgi:spermidine synthase